MISHTGADVYLNMEIGLFMDMREALQRVLERQADANREAARKK